LAGQFSSPLVIDETGALIDPETPAAAILFPDGEGMANSDRAHTCLAPASRNTDAANVRRLYPSHVHLTKGMGGVKMDSVAKAEQIRAIQVCRFVGYYGRLDRDALHRIEEAIKITLALR